MTKPMDPEIIALRAVDRAMRPLPLGARLRIADWLHDRVHADALRGEPNDGTEVER